MSITVKQINPILFGVFRVGKKQSSLVTSKLEIEQHRLDTLLGCHMLLKIKFAVDKNKTASD